MSKEEKVVSGTPPYGGELENAITDADKKWKTAAERLLVIIKKSQDIADWSVEKAAEYVQYECEKPENAFIEENLSSLQLMLVHDGFISVPEEIYVELRRRELELVIRRLLGARLTDKGKERIGILPKIDNKNTNTKKDMIAFEDLEGNGKDGKTSKELIATTKGLIDWTLVFLHEIEEQFSDGAVLVTELIKRWEEELKRME